MQRREVTCERGARRGSVVLRVLLVLLAVVLGFVALRELVHVFVPDETRIRWMLERMEEGYDEGRVRPCTEPFAPDWVHEGSSVGRGELVRGLQHRFLTERTSDGRLRQRVELDWGGMVLDVEGDQARVVTVVTFEELRRDAWEPRWRARIEAELADGPDGWCIERSRHQTLSGRGY